MREMNRTICLMLAGVLAVWSPALCCCAWSSAKPAANEHACCAGKQRGEEIPAVAAPVAIGVRTTHACQCGATRNLADEEVSSTSARSSVVFAAIVSVAFNATTDVRLAEAHPPDVSASHFTSTLFSQHCLLTT